MNKKPHIPPNPPRWASRLLEWYCKTSLHEDLQGDLLEYFERNVEKRGVAYAKLIYVVDVLKFFRAYTVQKPQILKRMNRFVLFSNYFKTSVRSMARNKLFTTINVVGLAVSMTIGLFMISLLYELNSYDSFHQKKERIYRLTNITELNGGPASFATTSILAGTQAKEEVPGIEYVVFVNGEFEKDVKSQHSVVPLAGDFASEDFFTVFSYSLIAGNPATALREPFSLVLTRSAAYKLFGEEEAIGKLVEVDGKEHYTITGIMEDVPANSHRQFECLASFSTYLSHEVLKRGHSEWWMHWQTMWDGYVYVLLEESASPDVVQLNLDRISSEESAKAGFEASVKLQPLMQIMHEGLYNQPPVIDRRSVWFMLLLSVFVIISACFNYTNLSIARALRRSKEVGVRKVVGATRLQIIMQFLLESVVISLFSLGIAVLLFHLLKLRFAGLIESFTTVRLSLPVLQVSIYFIALAILTGIVSGLLPAIIFSNMNAYRVFKGAQLPGFSRRIPFRKALIVFQYSLSVAFIVGASLVYKQYLYSMNFDLGYATSNILNIQLQGNDADVLKAQLAQVPGIGCISSSAIVNSTGNTWGLQITSTDPIDTLTVRYNSVDEAFAPMHQHQFLAGENFHHQPKEAGQIQIIINEQFLKRLQLQDPVDAIGKTLNNDLGEEKMVIVGVIEDFHYGTMYDQIEAFALIYRDEYRYLNVQIPAGDLVAAMVNIEEKWDNIDKVHPFRATFHDEAIQKAYEKYAAIYKAMGFLAIVAISIASLGLLGMVVFTTETRLKEISIRKVLGAREMHLIRLLGQSFLVLLAISALTGIPLAWYVGNEYFLQDFTYKASFGFWELFGGTLLIFCLAILLIASQTLKAARTNPANILRNE